MGVICRNLRALTINGAHQSILMPSRGGAHGSGILVKVLGSVWLYRLECSQCLPYFQVVLFFTTQIWNALRYALRYLNSAHPVCDSRCSMWVCLIRTEVQCILAYPNLDYLNPRLSELQAILVCNFEASPLQNTLFRLFESFTYLNHL